MSDIDLKISKALMHIPRLHKIRMSSHFSDMEIFACQLPTLHYIAKNNNPTQRELADGFQVAPPTMTAMIKRLEKGGYIVRNPDENDARIMRVSLSEKGRKMEQKTKQAFKIIEKELLSGFDKNEKAQLLGYLQRIAENLGGVVD